MVVGLAEAGGGNDWVIIGRGFGTGSDRTDIAMGGGRAVSWGSWLSGVAARP